MAKDNSADEFLGSILAAQVSELAATNNSLIEAGFEAAAQWAEMYDLLWRSVAQVNDGLKVYHVLDDLEQPDIQDRIEHYQRMAGLNEGELK